MRAEISRRKNCDACTRLVRANKRRTSVKEMGALCIIVFCVSTLCAVMSFTSQLA
jgi:hypothetical protein